MDSLHLGCTGASVKTAYRTDQERVKGWYRYRVEKLLGAGGMGEVYLVRHAQLPNTVAAIAASRARPARRPTSG